MPLHMQAEIFQLSDLQFPHSWCPERFLFNHTEMVFCFYLVRCLLERSFLPGFTALLVMLIIRFGKNMFVKKKKKRKERKKKSCM